MGAGGMLLLMVSQGEVLLGTVYRDNEGWQSSRGVWFCQVQTTA